MSKEIKPPCNHCLLRLHDGISYISQVILAKKKKKDVTKFKVILARNGILIAGLYQVYS